MCDEMRWETGGIESSASFVQGMVLRRPPPDPQAARLAGIGSCVGGRRSD